MAERNAARRNWLRWGAVAALAIVAVAIYVSLDAQSNTADAACAGAVERAAGLDAHAEGQMAAFRVAGEGLSVAEWAFQTADGADRSVADFAGRLVLLNLWATWCAPCVEEMPALNRLQTELGGGGFTVLTISLDQTNTPAGPRDFFAEHALDALDLYLDPSARLLGALRGVGVSMPGLPTTVLVDEGGCVLGIMQAPADWGGPDAMALIGAALAND